MLTTELAPLAATITASILKNEKASAEDLAYQSGPLLLLVYSQILKAQKQWGEIQNDPNREAILIERLQNGKL